MTTIRISAVTLITADIRRPARALFVALGDHVRVGLRSVSELVERRFAKFADVPYQSIQSRQQRADILGAELRTKSHEP
jgi:hypothetical protein